MEKKDLSTSQFTLWPGHLVAFAHLHLHPNLLLTSFILFNCRWRHFSQLATHSTHFMPPLQLLGVSGAELALNEQIKRQVQLSSFSPSPSNLFSRQPDWDYFH